MDAYLGFLPVCIVLVFAIPTLFMYAWTINTAFADGLPWADLRNEAFKTTRASLRQVFNCKMVLQDAYTKVDLSIICIIL